MRHVRPVICASALLCLLMLAGCAGTRGAVNNERAASANASLGADFLHKDENDRALASFRKALGYDSDNVSANWGMAIVSDRLGKTDDARRFYATALDLQPSAEIRNSYAAFLCTQGQVDTAVNYFQRAADDPRYSGAPDALANAGLCLHRAGRIEDAERYYREALAGDDTQVTALTQMARLEYDRGAFLKARAFIERADSVADLDADQLLLGARTELALNDRDAAATYLERHNASRPSATLSMRQLEQSTQ